MVKSLLKLSLLPSALAAIFTIVPVLSHDIRHYPVLPANIKREQQEWQEKTPKQVRETSSRSTSFGESLTGAVETVMPPAPAQFLDNQRLRVFAAEDVSDDVRTQVVDDINDAYNLWMGAPYYGKNQAKAIYLMIYGSDESAARKIEGEYCDHLSAVGFPSAEYCDPDQNSMWREYIEYGGAGLNSNGPIEGSTKLSMGVKNWDWDFRAIKNMAYHEIVHVYQSTNIFIDTQIALDDPYGDAARQFGRKFGDNLEGYDRDTPWASEGQADFLSWLYSHDRDYFKSSMKCALECDPYSSLPRKEWYLDLGGDLWNIAFEDPNEQVDLAYRIGAWFAAYLVSIHGEESIYRLWESADTQGFADSFEDIFGQDYKTYIQEFDVWLQQPNADLYKILDPIYENKMKSIVATDTTSNTFRMTLEEPVDAEIHTGVGNLRGWAVGDAGINKIEMWIDGVYAFDVPYGGVRGDVGGAFPDITGSNESGFSMAYSYSSLSSGDHSAKAIAYDTLGNSKESVSTDFSVVKLAEDFIGDPDAVNLDGASCSLERDEIKLVDALITDEPVDLLLKWRTAEQGFEIIEVRGGGSAVAMLRSRQALPVSAKSANAETSGSVFRAVLEEPVQNETHSGVGNLRGWAVASDGVEKIEIFIDGEYQFDAPYGGARQDVAGAFPDVSGSKESGFSLAFNYNDLSAGQHVIEAVAHSNQGGKERSSSTFNVVKFSESFINSSQTVDLNDASCVTDSTEIRISNAVVAGDTYDVVLDWRVAEQGFEIVEIR